jgi:hypothetical protein
MGGNTPTFGVNEVSAACFGDALYLLPPTHWYEGKEMLISPRHRSTGSITPNLSIENLAKPPCQRGHEPYGTMAIEANGCFSSNIEVGLLSFEVPKPYIYDPSAADGDEWTAMGYVRNFFGTHWVPLFPITIPRDSRESTTWAGWTEARR